MTSPTTPGTTLLLGGTGKVGRRIARLLQAANRPALIASRSGTAPAGMDGVAFDWTDRSTYARAFEVARAPITAVYITAPPSMDFLSTVVAFIDLAREKGVGRFVFMSSSVAEPGVFDHGKTHAYLKELGDRGEVEWAVLRPTWFQENFTESYSRESIARDGKLFSAAGDGKVPFVSADDIAAVGFEALTSRPAPNTDYVILGPELLTYDDVANIFTEVLGKKVVHIDIPESEREAQLVGLGFPPDIAKVLAVMDTAVKHGAENKLNDVVLGVTGKAPKSFRTFAEEERDALR